MLTRSRHSLPAILGPLVLLISSFGLVGCGKDDFSDDAYGFLDLSPYYYDGSTASDPNRGLTRDVRPHLGWVNGERAEYYDFGIVNVQRKRNATNTPDFAVVSPMYFFFDSQNRPIFSRPVYEPRTGSWFMKGGRKAFNLLPRDDAPRDLVYSIRQRDYFVDNQENPYLPGVPARNVPDYQRPIVDRLNNNGDYSGMWEITEIRVPDGYEPDKIKSWETLRRGVDSGKFELFSTGKVINCPILDERQTVVPTPMYYNIPYPRIELWYRTKQGSCFLSDGWLTLGDENGVPYPMGPEFYDRRLDTFDVLRYSIGDKASSVSTIIAPVGKLFQPRVSIMTQDPVRSQSIELRLIGDFLTDAAPRTKPSDPPGYRPIRWMWDVTVPQDPPYEPGTFKQIIGIDPAQYQPRGGTATTAVPWTRNFPLIGKAMKCTKEQVAAGSDPCRKQFAGPGLALECNLTPDFNIAIAEIPAGTRDINNDGKIDRDDLQMLREGGPRCDVPQVRFGEFCAPAVAKCALEGKPSGTGMAIPSEERGRLIDFRYEDRTSTTPENPTGVRLAAAASGKIFNPDTNTGGMAGGYTCLISPRAASGYCYFRCDSDQAAAAALPSQSITVRYVGPDGKNKSEPGTLPFDSRCGDLPGYRCLTPNTSPATPTRLRVCVRQCDPQKPDRFNDAFCQNPVNVSIRNEKVQDQEIQQGTYCTNDGISGANACIWNPAYEPRDPLTRFVPSNQ